MLTRGDIDVIEQAPGIAKDAHGRPIASAQLVVVANVPKKSDPKTDANVAIGFHGLPVVVSMLPGTMLLALLGGVIGAVIVWLAFNGYTASTLGGNFSQVVFQFRVTPELP